MTKTSLKTDWKSMWIAIFLQFLVGVQVSVYYNSMWSYLRGLDETADMDFLGWIVAACSVGQTISAPLYGYWNQKTMSVKWPTITGFIMAGIGQVWYGTLPIFSNIKWSMLFARLLTGLGVGNISVIRVYAATASTQDDRMEAISFGTAGYVCGLALGPVFSVSFLYISSDPDELHTILRDNFPSYNLTGYIVNGHTDIRNIFSLYGLLHLLLPAQPIYCTILILRQKIVKKLGEVSPHMRQNTKDMHTMLLKSLVIQAMLPLVNVVAIVLYILQMVGALEEPMIEDHLLLILIFVPLLNPVISFTFIRPYRAAVFSRCSKLSPNQVSSSSIDQNIFKVLPAPQHPL